LLPALPPVPPAIVAEFISALPPFRNTP
jgi:hypothetical protein